MLTAAEMELTYAAYQARQNHEVSLEGLCTRAAKIVPGGKFRLVDDTWKPQPYPGHAVVSMVDAAPANAALAAQLRWLQHELSHGFTAPGAMYLLPPSSFHQTVANTLSGEHHHQLVVARGIAPRFPEMVADAFSDFAPAVPTEPVTMRMIGLALFGTALGLLGVFDREDHFQRILAFRDRFYGHERIAALGIRRTRPFIGHITLAYIERMLALDERARLVEVLAGINETLATRELRFHVPRAELRAYDHLAEFKPLPHLPACAF